MKVARPAHLLLALLLVLELAAILVLNGGRLTFTLDDPYIHLALAESLARGHYGIHLAEPSAPASSILWPFLLAPLARTPIAELVPLGLNIVLAFLTIAVVGRFVAASFESSGVSEPSGETESSDRRRLAAFAVVLFVPAANLVGLVFTGMEHVLQLLLTVLLVDGMAAELMGRRRRWLPVWIVLLPLVRYETLTLALPALIVLVLRRRGLAAAGAGLGLVAGLGGFSLFLRGLGLSLLPSSVSAKSGVVRGGGGLEDLANNVIQNLGEPQGALLLLAAVMLSILAALPGRSRGERILALIVAAACGGHLLAGRIGWYHRYEIYIWAAVLLVHWQLLASDLLHLARRYSVARVAVLLAVLVGATGYEYFAVWWTNPIAANNIYEQQYQMHRFVTEHYREPVAVNDLGWVSFRNPHDVLDLTGLASPEALAARRAGHGGTSWTLEPAAARGVGLAIVYDAWVTPRPAHWQAVAELHLSRPRITVAHASITFFVLDPAKLEQARDALRDFETTLPPRLELVWL